MLPEVALTEAILLTVETRLLFIRHFNFTLGWVSSLQIFYHSGQIKTHCDPLILLMTHDASFNLNKIYFIKMQKLERASAHC
jgi:hypothetical protein